MRIAKILVGIDFSPQSERAIEQALDIARHYDAQVVLMHAGRAPHPPDDISERMDMLAGSFQQIVRQHLADHAHCVLLPFARRDVLLDPAVKQRQAYLVVVAIG